MHNSDFSQPSEFARNYLFFTDGIGHLKDPKFYIDRKIFRNNLIMYVLSGKLHIVQNGHHILKSGDLVIMRLTSQHKYYSDPIDSCEIYWLHFGDTNHPNLLNYIESTLGLPYIHNNHSAPSLLAKCLKASSLSCEERESIISEIVYQILIHASEIIRKSNPYLINNSKQLLKYNINNYINKHIYEKPDLEKLSANFGLSKYHFIKLFKEVFDETPITYYHQAKMEVAKGHLIYSNASISSIATTLGYDTQSYFSKVFKKYIGISPKTYRMTAES